MRCKALMLLLLLFVHYETTEAGGFWSFEWLTNSVNNFFSKSTRDSNSATMFNRTNYSPYDITDAHNIGIKRAATKDDGTNFWESSQIPPHCEEAILVPLARLKIVSPEKIIELVTTNDLEQICYRVGSTVALVQKAIENCPGFPPEHLYKKLTDGLQEFDSIICADLRKDGTTVFGGKQASSSKKRLIDYRECLNQLQEELYDCEGPPDWFEKRNSTIACQFYNDIIDCNYVKTAMLCGKSAARLIRDFSDAIMRKVLLFRCKKSRATPHVENPMIDKSTDLEISAGVLLFAFALIYFLA